MGLVSLNPVVQRVIASQSQQVRIAFLVGNGFDIGIGLNTDYKSFIGHYISRKIPHSEIIQNLIEHINRNASTWADAEYAFGQLPFSELGSDAESAFRACLNDFQRSLEEYLFNEASRLVIPEEKVVQIRTELLQSIIEAIKSADETLLADKSMVAIDVLNFNYTDTVDRLLGGAAVDVTLDVGERPIQVSVGQICHVHGKLGGRILFGVDNSSQILDDTIHDLSEEEGYLIKQEKATIGHCQFYTTAQRILSECDIAVLFGLSYGKTDLTWWKNLIAPHFKHGISRRVNIVLSSYDSEPIEDYLIEDARYITRKERDRFFKSFMDEGEEVHDEDVLKDIIAVVRHGPFPDPQTKESYYCDPLHLHSIGIRCVNGYDRTPIRKAAYP